MKTHSNIPIPEIQLWKQGQYMMTVNPVDKGEMPEGEEGNRYEVDFTIVDALSAEDAIYAFTRMTQEPVRDDKIIHNMASVGEGIEYKPEYTNHVTTNIFPPLPNTGLMVKGHIYSYEDGAVMVEQDHQRTIYAPELTPALFSFYRPNTPELLWIPNEQVQIGWKRWFNDKQYDCIQSHMTLSTWTPDVTPALWQEVIATPDYPVWQQPTGAHDAYQIGDRVHFPDADSPVYESLINANTWSPIGYPAGWLLIT
jgi:hypothetical protein